MKGDLRRHHQELEGRSAAPTRPITVITREEGSGTRGAFEELVMKKAEDRRPAALVQDSTGAVREMVHGDPAAIGYISLGQVNDQVKALQARRRRGHRGERGRRASTRWCARSCS